MRRALLVVIAVGLFGCEEKKAPSPAPSASATAAVAEPAKAAPSASVAPAASAMAPASDDAGSRQSAHMAHCPTAAPGATVTIKDVDGGVELSIAGKDETSTKDIRDRMAKLVASDKNEAAAGVKHTGKGEGGGIYGRCSIVMKNTKLETAEIPNGVKAIVKASDKSEIDWLRRETRDRDKEARAPGAEAAGSHRMAHCPSAVPGAKTAVKDTSDGVIVTVTGKGDAVKDIRDRSKHTAEIAKLPDPPKVEHNSEGKGGGGLGRCPVIVEGFTTVDVKDVEGGSELTVKAKKDVPALQKEAKARAANFAAK